MGLIDFKANLIQRWDTDIINYRLKKIGKSNLVINQINNSLSDGISIDWQHKKMELEIKERSLHENTK